jgi:hypothetical protein
MVAREQHLGNLVAFELRGTSVLGMLQQSL